MDQHNTAQFLDLLRQGVWYTTLEDVRKDYFMNMLTEARYEQLTADEAMELIGVLPDAIDKLEQKVLESNDADAINVMTDLKEFINKTQNDGQRIGLTTVRDAIMPEAKETDELDDSELDADESDEDDFVVTASSPQVSVLDNLAGLE